MFFDYVYYNASSNFRVNWIISQNLNARENTEKGVNTHNIDTFFEHIYFLVIHKKRGKV